MKTKKLLTTNLALTILSSILSILLSLLSIVTFSLIVSFLAIAGQGLPGWFGAVIIFNIVLAVIAIIGAGLAFKFSRTGFIISLVCTILSLVLPISFWGILDFQPSAIGIVLMLLIPTIFLVIVTVLNIKVIKINKYGNINIKN